MGFSRQECWSGCHRLLRGDCYSASNHSTRQTVMFSLSSSLPFTVSSVSLMKSRERKSTTARKETLQTLRSTPQPFPGQWCPKAASPTLSHLLHYSRLLGSSHLWSLKVHFLQSPLCNCFFLQCLPWIWEIIILLILWNIVYFPLLLQRKSGRVVRSLSLGVFKQRVDNDMPRDSERLSLW